MAEARKSLLLRLDPALHAAVEQLAAAELRSTNAEIELLLREGLARRGFKLPSSPPVKRGRPAVGGSETS